MGVLKSSAYWLIRDGDKLLQCSKEDFDRAIIEGKSVKYGGYAGRKSERIADELESSRMEFIGKPDLSPKFRAILTAPKKVIEVQVVSLMDSQFWVRESKLLKYRK